MGFYDSTKVVKKSGWSREAYLLPRAIYKNPLYDHVIRHKHNIKVMLSFKESGYKIILLCPSNEYEWNKILVNYADEVITY